MPFPPSNREVYRKNPLDEVICQLRFPTILQVATENPAQFQNAIRHKYPLYNREGPLSAGLPKEIADILAAVPVPMGLQQSEHRFLTEDESRIITLTQDFIAIAEKEYSSWESCRTEVGNAESAFREIYQPSFYSRIGLRYRDVVDRNELGLEDCPWSELLNPHIAGVLGADDLKDEPQDIRTQSLIRLPEVPGGFVRLSHGLSQRPEERTQVYLIDADFYTEERSELDDAFAKLDSFNEIAGRLFRWAVTDRLRNALEPSRI